MIKRKAPKARIPTEHQEQAAFVYWMKVQHPTIKFFAVPNGMWSRNFAQVQKAKNEGLMNGVPDICIPRIPALFDGNIWIEFKRLKGGRVSPEQKAWHEYLELICRDYVIVAKGFDEAKEQVGRFLKGTVSVPCVITEG